MIGQKNIVDLPGGKDSGKDGGDGKSKSKPAARPTVTEDRDLRSRLSGIFDRIAESAEARGDSELAEVIREDTRVMATGLVSLTRPFKLLRAPVVMLLGIVEPVMAFSRITRLILDRLLEQRAEKRAGKRPPVQ